MLNTKVSNKPDWNFSAGHTALVVLTRGKKRVVEEVSIPGPPEWLNLC